MAEVSPSILSAEWINQRFTNVMDRVDQIVDRLLIDGIFSSGYGPLEQPITKAILRKMRPDQLLMYLASLQTPEERVAVLEMLGLPLEELYGILGSEPNVEEGS